MLSNDQLLFNVFLMFLLYDYNELIIWGKTMSQDESELESSRSPRPAKPPLPHFSFKNVDANRHQILKNNQRKYEYRKPSIPLCIVLGLFLLPGLLLYLGGLFVYNKVAEHKFNKKQATEIQETQPVKKAKQPHKRRHSGVDPTETGDSSYSKSQKSLHSKSRGSASSSVVSLEDDEGLPRDSRNKSRSMEDDEGAPLNPRNKRQSTANASASVSVDASEEGEENSSSDTESPQKSPSTPKAN